VSRVRTARLPEIITREQADRFWSYVDIQSTIDCPKEEDRCWPWLGGLVPGTKYGQFGLSGKYRAVRAPRLAFRLLYGGDPFPLDILHKRCDNGNCCNPDHYALGERKDNNADRHAKGRTAHGDKLQKTGVTAQELPNIIRRRAAGETLESIAETYGVYSTNIGDIFLGKTWSKETGFPLIKPGRNKKLSDDQAREAHRRRAAGEILRTIAADLGVSTAVIQKTISGKLHPKIWLEFQPEDFCS
jgi:hypothetical protein